MKIPREPSAGMRMAAMQMHEMYTAMVDAGFTEAQAMQAVFETLKTAVQAPPPDGEKK